jgi:cytidylate kinase
MAYSVITISREFGTGARLIGKQLADILGFNYYDRAIIQMAAEKSGLSPEFIERNEEKTNNSFLFNLSTSAYITSGINLQYTMPVNDKAFIAQSEVIKEIARSGNSIIVGRCADYVLHEHPKLLRVFLYGEKEDRLNRIVNDYGYDAAKAESDLNKIDKGRANYHKFYTGVPWKDLSNYDICLSTTKSGIEGSIKTLKTLADSYFR